LIWVYKGYKRDGKETKEIPEVVEAPAVLEESDYYN